MGWITKEGGMERSKNKEMTFSGERELLRLIKKWHVSKTLAKAMALKVEKVKLGEEEGKYPVWR